jgi:hypothetical protein
VLKCPFIMKIYHRFLLPVIFYFKIDKITGKSRFQVKATLVSVVAVYRNTTFIYQVQHKVVANTHTSAGGWGTVQCVVMHGMLCLKHDRISAYRYLQTWFGKPLSRLGRKWKRAIRHRS